MEDATITTILSSDSSPNPSEISAVTSPSAEISEGEITAEISEADITTDFVSAPVTLASGADTTVELSETISVTEYVYMSDPELNQKLDDLILIGKSTYSLIMIGLAVVIGGVIIWKFLSHFFRY